MKKLIFTAVALVGSFVLVPELNAQFGMSASGPAAGGNCANTCINALRGCLDENEVSFDLNQGSGGTMYLSTYGSFPPGQLTSCVAQYNSCRHSCPSAPAIVVASRRTGKS